MRTLSLGLAAASILCFAAPLQAQQKAAPKPNIVVILADDMGYSDLGCYGSEIQTPNLDRLASKGLRFTNFYNTARCCPSRASLMTGLYAHQAGMGNMNNDQKKPGYRGELNRTSVTIAEVLRMIGYWCGMVGKWHLTNAQRLDGPIDSWPLQRGFERYFGTLNGAGSYYKPPTLTRDNTRIEAPPGFYYTDAISENAVQFIQDQHKARADQPIFLYVAYTAPHWPLHAPAKEIAKYEEIYLKGWDVLNKERYERLRKSGIVDPNWPVPPRDKQVPAWDSLDDAKKKEMAHKMAVYAAQIDRLDQGVGRIVDALKKTNRLDDTLILFMADNGGCEEGGIWGFERKKGGTVGEDSSFASYGRGWAWLSNCIFRLFKHWIHGGGTRSPLIAHWPNGIADQNQLRRQPAHLIDIMATCVELSGAKYPTEFNGNKITPLEGKSLVPAFANKPIEREAIYWEHEGNRGVLVKNWKLVAVGGKGPWELYDLAKDGAETNNLVNDYPEITRDLAAKWQAWAVRALVVDPPQPRTDPDKKDEPTPKATPQKKLDESKYSPMGIKPGSPKLPVKVFILAGQSNMDGQGVVYGNSKGTLETLAKEPESAPRFKHLVDKDGKWITRGDVWITGGQKGDLKIGQNWNGHIGPEIGFGWVMGEHFENQVLLIKFGPGGTSLASNWRPPGAGGKVGEEYEKMIRSVKQQLENLKVDFPGYAGQGYEIVGFGWHQGWQDGLNDTMANEYESNLAHFIRDVRKDLGVPKLPFVIGGSGFGGREQKIARRLKIMESQEAVAKYAEFKGNVSYVETRDMYRDEANSPHRFRYHWNGNAETYYLIGEGMGKAMLRLLQPASK